MATPITFFRAGDRDASRARSGVTESAFRVRLTLMC